MNRGIETAFWATLGKDPELKTSKAGTAYTGMNVVVTVGATDDGKDVSQWLRVTCFGDTAKAIASRAKKGDRIYVEGTLTLNAWADKSTGETKTGLNVAAWKCERVSSIGKSRERRATQGNGDATSKRQDDRRSSKYDFNDDLSF